MSEWWSSVRLRRRVAFGVCGAALVALVGVMRGSLDVATAGVLVSAIAAVVSVAAFLSDALRDSTDTPQSADEVRRRTADSLAEAVREPWATEARLRRLQDPGPLEVRWTPADRWLADHPENIGQGAPAPAPREAEHPLDAFLETFEALPARRLVVLGGPGSGKSVLALRFTLGRLAAREPGGPVPVIFPVSSWDPLRTGLRDWLAERLAADYRFLAAPADGPRTLGRALLDTGFVLPVLDGFDELPRAVYGETVRRINSELDGDLPLLLTSRTEAWAAAVRARDVLTAAEVVELLPLDADQTGAYLERTARPGRSEDGHRETVWTPVLQRLALAQESHPLNVVLRVPLMVALARTVYGDTSRDPAELLDPARFPASEDIEEHLLDAFVPAAFADCGPRRAVDARRRLGLLARELERRRTGRLAWWELESAVPGAVRAYATGLLAIAATCALLPVIALARTSSRVAAVEDLGSLGANLAGETLGYAFGVAFLLPRTAGRQGSLPRRLAIVTAAATALWLGMALTDDLRFGFRLGGATDGVLPDLFGGCLFAILLTLFFGVAGLPRHPVPLSLPWAGSSRGRAAVLVCGALLLACGAGLIGSLLLGMTVTPLTALTGAMCTVAGGTLLLGGTRRAVRDSAPRLRRGRISRDFTAGLVRGLAAALLIGVVASTAAGTAAAVVTVLRSGSQMDLDGRRIGDWSFLERNGIRTATTDRPLSGRLLVPGHGALSVAYPADITPPNCEMPLLPARRCVDFTSRRTVFESHNGAVTVRLAPAAGWPGRAEPSGKAYAANMRSVLPEPARAWLTEGPAPGVFARCLPPMVAAGVLFGVVGGCVCGVYRALSAPSDVVRAASPRSTLRTDRTASLARGGVVALLTGFVCLPVVLLSRDWGGLVTVGAQLWLPVGATALALGAWGRFVITRAWLATTGRLPWRLMGFLDEAHRRGVLRQSGAYYEFRHLRLQRRLAGAGTPAGGGSADERVDALG